MLFDVQVDDQDTADTWLRRGAVSAAVTGQDRAVPGCDVLSLGSLRYIAVASPDFMTKHFPDGPTVRALQSAPMLTFTHKDKLQSQWMKNMTGATLHPPSHLMPSTHAFLDAALLGIAWGMNPLSLAEKHLKTGKLVALSNDVPLDVPLFWQVTRVLAPALRPLTQAIQRSASKNLRTKA